MSGTGKRDRSRRTRNAGAGPERLGTRVRTVEKGGVPGEAEAARTRGIGGSTEGAGAGVTTAGREDSGAEIGDTGSVEARTGKGLRTLGQQESFRKGLTRRDRPGIKQNQTHRIHGLKTRNILTNRQGIAM